MKIREAQKGTEVQGSYHAPAPIVRHPSCPPPVFKAMTPSEIERYRRVEAQEAIFKSMRRLSPLAVQLIDRMLRLTEEFSPEDVRRWFRTSALIEFGDVLPGEESAPEAS